MVQWNEPVDERAPRVPWSDLYITVRIGTTGCIWRATLTPYASDGTSGVAKKRGWRPLGGREDFDELLAFIAGVRDDVTNEIIGTPASSTSARRSSSNGSR